MLSLFFELIQFSFNEVFPQLDLNAMAFTKPNLLDQCH